MSDFKDIVEVTAHRGDTRVHIENTIGAFRDALAYSQEHPKVTGIELDIQLTKDEQVIVYHDENLKRLLDDGRQVIDIHADEMKGLMHGKYSDQPGNAIPLLSEVINLIDHRLKIFIELKRTSYDPALMAEKLNELMKTYHPKSDVIVISFDSDLLMHAKAKCQQLDIKYGLNVYQHSPIDDHDAKLLEELDFINPAQDYIESMSLPFTPSPSMAVWTVNDDTALNRISNSSNADSVKDIITDNVEFMINSLSKPS